MARILYGIPGEGYGHAVRAKTVIDFLIKKGHKVKIAAGGNAYTYLKKYYPVERIGCFYFIYRQNKVSQIETGIYSIIKFPFVVLYNLKLFLIYRKFRPEIILTDFEPFTSYLSWITNKPSISLDAPFLNKHMVRALKVKEMPWHSLGYFFANLIVTAFTQRLDRCITSCFFRAKVSKKVTLVSSILRDSIKNSKTKEGNHIIVYQTAKSHKGLIKTLAKIKEEFTVYGFDKERKIKNIRLKKFDEKGFAADLSKAKAVICTGGYNLIAESLYLKKPILSIPIKHQYERFLNSYYLKKTGYGEIGENFDKETIIKFIENIGKYKKALKKAKKENPDEYEVVLEKAIKEFS